MGNFWQEKTLESMSTAEWELLCDGCGKCCLVKLEDRESGEIFHTNVTCKLLDIHNCSCTQYSARHAFVNDCISLTRENIGTLSWLPESCAYRLLEQGRPLPSWHHLVSGNRESVHSYGASLRGWVISELDVQEEDIEERIIRWVDE